MQAPPPHLIYEFGDFELDALRRVLVSKLDGKPVDITGRVLDALVYLIERPGQLADKRSLMQALWPRVVVEEGNLTQTIHSLRRVLGERPGEHRYIATVPGRGYQFVAQVRVRTEQASPEPVPPGRRKTVWRVRALSVIALVAVAAAAALAVHERRDQNPPVTATAVRAPPSIAVLPFVDMSAEQDQEHFAEGLSEEILNQLAHTQALRVIARTSSFSFKGQNADVRTIARRLDVTYVLQGSVRKSGERVRITAQLIDASSSAHVWSETYDRELRDLFAVQSEIANGIANALHVTLGRNGPRRAETASEEAYEHYLQGRHLFHRRSGSDLLQAKAHFEQAVRIDPAYGRAWAALAGVYRVAPFEGFRLSNAMQHWREAAERAVTLAPDMAEAQMRVGQYLWVAGDRHAAEEHFRRALALDPADSMVMGMTVDRAIGEGRLADAIEQQKRIVANDPLSALHRSNLGGYLIGAGRISEARAELERALELSPAGNGVTENIANVLLLQGHTDEALKAISRLPAGFPRDQYLALAAFARGESAEGRVILNRLLALGEKPAAEADIAFAIAQVYAAKNEPEQAFHWLDTAYSRLRSRSGILTGEMLGELMQLSPYLQTLHADPRWARLLAELRS